LPNILCWEGNSIPFSLKSSVLSLDLLAEWEVLVVCLGKLYELISVVWTVGVCCSPG